MGDERHASGVMSKGVAQITGSQLICVKRRPCLWIRPEYHEFFRVVVFGSFYPRTMVDLAKICAAQIV